MWRTITEDDLRSSINRYEDAAIRAAALSEGQADPFTTVKTQITDLFRNAIRGGAGGRLDPDITTLPPAAIFHAVAKIRYRLLTRFAAELIDDDRRAENKEAESWLKEVRRGLEKIEQPGDDPATPTAPSINLMSNSDRQASRDSLRGL